MRLIITEKPSMGRDVASALGATRKGEGFLSGAGDIVTWCIGHLVELNEPDAYDERLKRWRLDDLPIIPDKFGYHASERTREQFGVIKTLLGRVDVTEVVNATDAGREGELIFWLVYQLAKCQKPVRRLWISSLTVDAILDGFRNLRPAEDFGGLKDSAYSRQQSDWLVGLNATRAQSCVARLAGYDGVFSLGRVQTPTLALIFERDREIAEFVPQPYYEVVGAFSVPGGVYSGTWFNRDGSRFDKLEDAQSIVERVRGRQGTVEKVEKKAVRERPPLLFDLTLLQRTANARHSFTAQKTLELAQSLYEKKYITYPRTSSRHLSSSVGESLRAHVEATNIGPYADFVKSILAKGKLRLSSRHVDDKKVTDHHAIIPTNQRVSSTALSPDEKRIYDLIARRFLAAFFDDAEIERTTVITAVEGETFRTKGSRVIKAGWREVDPPAKERNVQAEDDESEADVELPEIKKGEIAAVTDVEAVSKQTKAPPRYTEASLLGAMETAGKKIDDDELRLAMKDAGLGTPATRASIIETLLKREYIRRDKKAVVATPKGASLIRMLPVPLLKSAELTGMWEQKLSRMTRNEYSRDAFMEEVKAMVREITTQIGSSRMEPAERKAEEGDVAQVPRPKGALDCPKCKNENRDGFLIERKGAKGKFLVCSRGRGTCGFITDPPRNAKQRKAMLTTPCHLCGSAMRFRKPQQKDRPDGLSCVKYPDCRGFREFDDKGELVEPRQTLQESGPPCKLCGAPTVLRGPFANDSFFWGCSKFRRDGAGCNAPPLWVRQ
jgi:DNA topoisomerase-3